LGKRGERGGRINVKQEDIDGESYSGYL